MHIINLIPKKKSKLLIYLVTYHYFAPVRFCVIGIYIMSLRARLRRLPSTAALPPKQQIPPLVFPHHPALQSQPCCGWELHDKTKAGVNAGAPLKPKNLIF